MKYAYVDYTAFPDQTTLLVYINLFACDTADVSFDRPYGPVVKKCHVPDIYRFTIWYKQIGPKPLLRFFLTLTYVQYGITRLVQKPEFGFLNQYRPVHNMEKKHIGSNV